MAPHKARPIGSYGPTDELEFRVNDDESFLVAAAAAHGCELVVEEIIQQRGGAIIQFVSVSDGAVLDVLGDATAREGIVDARVLQPADTDGLGLLELVTLGPSLARTVAQSRGLARRISADRSGGRIVIEVPPSTDPQQVIDVVRSRHPDARLVARTEHETGFPLGSGAVADRLLYELTDRQIEALTTAYRNGYFETPHRTTAAECARRLDISQSTFSQHLSAALRKVLRGLLADE